MEERSANTRSGWNGRLRLFWQTVINWLAATVGPTGLWRRILPQPEPPKHHIFAIVNPVSGFGSRGEVEETVRAAFGSCLHELYLTQGNDPFDELIPAAIENGATCVVASGGDGTVAAAAHPLVGTDIPLGIIPTGTANVVATNLEIPSQLERAIQLITGHHQVRSIDVLEVEGRTALLSVGAGIDGAVIKSTTRDQKKRFGRWAYFKSIVQAIIKADNHRLKLEIDGTPLNRVGIGVMALNMQKVGVGPLSYGKYIALDDGIIDVAVARMRNWRDVWHLFKGFLSGNFREPKVMTHYPMRRKLVIDAKTPLEVQMDGESLGKTPVTIYLKPSALNVIVPAPQGELDEFP